MRDGPPQTGTFYSGNASNVSKAYSFQETNHERSGQSPADMVIYNKTEKIQFHNLRILYMSTAGKHPNATVTTYLNEHFMPIPHSLQLPSYFSSLSVLTRLMLPTHTLHTLQLLPSMHATTCKYPLYLSKVTSIRL